MIDLRSDTLTRPCNDMRKAIASADCGDDVYGEDPTVNKLQEMVADYFGKEAALFVPSGTMSNQIALKLLTNPGDEVICDADAHIYYYETAAPAVLSGLQIRPIPSKDGMPSINDIKSAIRPDIYYFPKSALISLENTHNRHGGAILDLEYINAIGCYARDNSIKFHLDGARIWNAIIAKGIKGADWAKPFDTLSVCLSKGLGAPIGSLIVSTKENISKALKWRKIFGGGMRQAGLIAAAGIFAIENNLQKLEYDHENAKVFAGAIASNDKINLDIDKVQTNIVRFELDKSINPTDFINICKNQGVLLSHFDGQLIRAVFYLDITKEQAGKASEIINSAIKHTGSL